MLITIKSQSKNEYCFVLKKIVIFKSNAEFFEIGDKSF